MTVFVNGVSQDVDLNSAQTLTNKTLTAPKIAQVVFPGTQVASADANTQDDYEEGAWTPALADASFDGSGEGQGYTVQVGRYTKIGNQVHIQGRLILSSLGTLTTGQNAFIVGLPFTSTSVTNAFSAFLVGQGDNLAIGAGEAVSGFINPNVTRIDLQQWIATSGSNTLTIAEVSADGAFIFDATYEV